MFFDNELEVTPSFIAGGKESSYTELNYQVIVTATIDGTTYTNKIPVQSAEDEDDNTGNTTYTDSKTSRNIFSCIHHSKRKKEQLLMCLKNIRDYKQQLLQMRMQLNMELKR